MRFKMRFKQTLVLCLGFLTLSAGGLTASAGSKHVAKLSMQTARAKALTLVPGKVKAEELEKEHGRWIYSFEIRPDGETRKIVKEVNLDADTGEQVGKIDTEKD